MEPSDRFEAAVELARHIASGILDRGDVEAALQVTGETAGGQTPAGVAATIRSAIAPASGMDSEPLLVRVRPAPVRLASRLALAFVACGWA